MRVGEADHPGPRRRVPADRLGKLADVHLVSGQTLALEARLLAALQELAQES